MVRGNASSSSSKDDHAAAASASASASTAASTAASQVKASKRRCVQSACVPCRKRKSKCDGGTPVCATCTAVYKTPCHYDEQSESRRNKTATVSQKRERDGDASHLEQSNSDNAEFLINSIRTLPECEAFELIQHIRKDPRLDVGLLAETWKKTVTLPIHPPAEQASLERDLSLLMGKPARTQTGESRHFGHSSGLGLVPEDEDYTRGRVRNRMSRVDEHRNGTWTNVTKDLAFVERLLDLYFRWSHPFYVIFSRECFYKDFRSGRQKYCSPLLVNAILAYACHFTDEPAGRTDPDNFRTAGDHFFAEARRLLFEDETPSLLTTQALCVMSMREPSTGRDSSGFMYIGRCMRMIVELGLHLNNTSPELGLTPSEVEVCKVTFWGCFTVETVWSLSIGRISQLPRAAITLDKPILEEPTMGGKYENYYGAHALPPGTVTSRVFLQEFSSLSELINDNNYMYFAPKERFTSRRLLDMYNKYQNWYTNLPAPLCLPEDTDADSLPQPQPHIVVLHMLYFTVLVHLFRPMLKVDLVHSDLRPRDICVASANRVTELLRLYRKYYSMRACQLVLTHILLSVSIVHLLYSQENSTSSTNLVDSLQGLEDLSICHYFGARSFKIVHSLARTWNLPWPEALKLSKLVPKDDAPLESPSIDTMFATRSTPVPQEPLPDGYSSQIPPASLPPRRESLSMFSLENREPSFGDHLSVQGNSGSGMNATSTMPYATSSSTNLAATSGPTAGGPAEQLFWTPMPGLGVPIIHRNYQVSPMDLNSMLGSVDDWDRFGRDGFKMSDTWVPDSMPFQGPNFPSQVSGAPDGFPGPPTATPNLAQPPVSQSFEWWGGSNAAPDG